jgi:hypothetical protein
MRAAHLARGTYPPAAGRPWTPEENALLGTMLDREVGDKIGRAGKDVAVHRKRLGILSYRKRMANANR